LLGQTETAFAVRTEEQRSTHRSLSFFRFYPQCRVGSNSSPFMLSCRTI